VTMFLVVGMICYGIFGQPGEGDRVGCWWVCSSFVDERGVVYVAKLAPPSLNHPVSNIYHSFFSYQRCHGSVVEWLLREKGWGMLDLGRWDV